MMDCISSDLKNASYRLRSSVVRFDLKIFVLQLDVVVVGGCGIQFVEFRSAELNNFLLLAEFNLFFLQGRNELLIFFDVYYFSAHMGLFRPDRLPL
jgi:hypothetical protein